MLARIHRFRYKSLQVISESPMARAIVALLVLTMLAAKPVAAGLEALLGRAEGPAGAVVVAGWIERSGATPEVVVRLRAEGEARLVADPGITIEAAPRDGLAWLAPMPHRLVAEGEDYFDSPTEIRLAFADEDGRPIELRIDYAYCFTDLICLFGDETLVLATRAP